MKYHLTTVSVSGPLVKGEYASELFHVFDISEVHDWLPISWIEILYSRMISASTYMMTGSGTLNPTIRANRQVVVRQYTRGLRIALEFNDVLVSVVRGHELSLRAAAEATNVLNCLDVHCEIPFCGGHAELGTDQRRDHVLRGGPLERNFFVWHCTLLVAFIGPVSSIAVASRIKELHPVNVNKIPVVLPARFLVIPRLSALAAFQIHAAAFVEVLAGDFRAPPERLHAWSSPFLSFQRSVLAIENCAMTAPCGLYFSSGSRPR